MARTIKQGLDYFPFDVDFYQDLKIRKLIKYQGGKAISVYTLLLCIIYRNGYYIRWDKELPFMISELTGYTEANIQEVIECCMNIGLLSRELFESEGILTSKGIQARYACICSSSRRRGTIAEYSLMPRKSADGVTGSKGKKTRHQPQQTDSKDSAVSAPPASKEKAPRKKKTAERPADPPAEYSLTVDQEIPLMAGEQIWAEAICKNHSISADEFRQFMEKFALHCKSGDVSHSSLSDAKRHFNDWLKYAIKNLSNAPDANKPSPQRRTPRRAPVKPGCGLIED